MNLFNRGFGNIFNGGIFGNTFPIVMDELEYPKISVVDVVDGILDTLRGIESDKLIQEKELAEIEATVSTYADYTKFHQDTLNKSYDLEKKELELIQLITGKIVILLEKIENIDTDNSKFKSYIEIINRYQKILEKIVDNSGKYFNEKIIEANKIDIPDFIRYTEIGKYQGKKSLHKLK